MKNSISNVLIIIFCIILTGCDIKNSVNIINNDEIRKIEENNDTGYIVDDIKIKSIDGTNYEFSYNGQEYKVLYVSDTWKIYDSYKITNTSDIKKICQALIDIHPIPGSDMISYRTSSDMTYEWLQHNLAYKVLPESNSFRNSAKDVDLDPKDQGKSLVEIYEDRTGKKLDLGSLLN